MGRWAPQRKVAVLSDSPLRKRSVIHDKVYFMLYKADIPCAKVVCAVILKTSGMGKWVFVGF